MSGRRDSRVHSKLCATSRSVAACLPWHAWRATLVGRCHPIARSSVVALCALKTCCRPLFWRTSTGCSCWTRGRTLGQNKPHPQLDGRFACVCPHAAQRAGFLLCGISCKMSSVRLHSARPENLQFSLPTKRAPFLIRSVCRCDAPVPSSAQPAARGQAKRYIARDSRPADSRQQPHQARTIQSTNNPQHLQTHTQTHQSPRVHLSETPVTTCASIRDTSHHTSLTAAAGPVQQYARAQPLAAEQAAAPQRAVETPSVGGLSGSAR